MVQPVKEVLIGIGSHPDAMISAKMAAIAVLGVDHLEKVVQAHHLCVFLSLSLLLRLSFPILLQLVAAQVAVDVGAGLVVLARMSRDLGDASPLVLRERRALASMSWPSWRL